MSTKPDMELPEVIAYRTKNLAPLLQKWRNANPWVPWSVVIERGLKKELAELATKREQHLLAA